MLKVLLIVVFECLLTMIKSQEMSKKAKMIYANIETDEDTYLKYVNFAFGNPEQNLKLMLNTD